jgi:hypothetical protein
VVLGQDHPLPSIKEELVPQGHAKDAAAHNANLELFRIAGAAAAPSIVPANADKLDDYEIDDNGGIIAMGDIPQQPPHAPFVVNNTDKDGIMGSGNNSEETESNNDNGSNNNNDDNSSGNDSDNELVDSVAATDVDNNKSGSNQGVRRSRRRGEGVTKKYADYILLMVARQAKRGGLPPALIHNGCIFFSADNLSDAKPIPEENREEFALGVALVHYLMNAGIKKFKAKGEAGVTKELTQMHDMSVFCLIEVKALTYNKRKKALLLLML